MAWSRPMASAPPPQGHQVDGQKAFGHPLAHAHQHHHGQQPDSAAL